ncbi:barstar family protein [Bernardetia sp.]|uniref:barstar family protein n=1 Tax=Bernardetia sp. TaxID=1937974 RepID=UPI0025BDC1BD|nr:barstar family protein [Bernardetia sp.]
MQYIEKIEDKEYFITEINTSKCKGKQGLIEEFSIAFSIYSIVPNLDALNDFLTGLEWIEQKNYKLILKNMNKVEKSRDDYDELFSLIKYLEEHWQREENNFIVEYVSHS